MDAEWKNNIKWQEATLIDVFPISSNIRGMRFSIPDWTPHIPGQHYDVSLSLNGNELRKYSATNSPIDEGIIEIAVQILENGKISPHLWNMSPGERVEIRGPIGTSFCWDMENKGALCLIGGGVGLAPLMSIIRHHTLSSEDLNRDVRVLASVGSSHKAPYFDELNLLEKKYQKKIVWTFTRDKPLGWSGYFGRINKSILEAQFDDLLGKGVTFFVSGSTGFAESILRDLISIGFNLDQIKTERFGGK